MVMGRSPRLASYALSRDIWMLKVTPEFEPRQPSSRVVREITSVIHVLSLSLTRPAHTQSLWCRLFETGFSLRVKHEIKIGRKSRESCRH